MKRRSTLRVVAQSLLCLACLAFGHHVGAEHVPLAAPYESYTYDFWGNPVPAPQAYLPASVLDGDKLGVGPLRDPQDIYVDVADRIVIADTGNNRLIIVDEARGETLVIAEFQTESGPDSFRQPQGLFVTAAGRIYVADTGNGRIVELSARGEHVRTIGPPEPTVENVFSSNFVYRPKKVGVDPAGRIYVIAENVFDGLLEFNSEGVFTGFVGAPRVSPSVADLFWSRIATQAQRERLTLFLPVEFSGLDVGPKGLVYAVEQGVAKETSIKRLTWDGTDILARLGYHPPMGDLDQGNDGSVFIDIAVRDNGLYTVLDRQWGRAFTYDDNGNLLYVFGGIGEMVGLARRPVAIDNFSDHRLAVLDAQGTVTVFVPTEYGTAIHLAIEHYHRGDYEESTRMWHQVLRFNGNFNMAYTGIGRAYLRQGDAEAALEAFRLGQNRTGYSDAYALYRREKAERNFSVVMSVLTGLVALIVILRKTGVLQRASRALGFVARWMNRPFMAELRYALHVIGRPFQGFWDLKHENKGSVRAATAILLMTAATYIFARQYTGFIFNTRNLAELNVVVEALSVIVPFVLWAVVNWALTTLMQGKGTMKDIYVASAYALTPLIVVNVPATILSNYLRTEEGGLYALLLGIGMAWTGLLLLVSMMMVHDYSGAKALLTSSLVVAGIAVVIFIGLLSVTVVNHMAVFLYSVYAEVVLRT